MTLQILESLSKSLDTIRSMLKSYQLLEVFTPILHNRCDFPSDSHFPIEKNDIFQEDMFLRICMELRLRQLLEFSISCGVYEIGACFRKEYGVGRICEFHMLELFEKSPSYDGLINQIFEIVKTVHKNVCDEELNIDAIPVTDLVSKAEIDSIRISTKGNDKEFIKFFESSLDTRLNEINKTKRAYLVYDYPVESMSVAKRKEQDSDMIERFELFIGGQEIGHGFTDSVDSDDVENRMEKLGWRDSALIAQLRNHKLPESGGFGIGIERLVQVSMGVKNIKDVVVPQIL